MARRAAVGAEAAGGGGGGGAFGAAGQMRGSGAHSFTSITPARSDDAQLNRDGVGKARLVGDDCLLLEVDHRQASAVDRAVHPARAAGVDAMAAEPARTAAAARSGKGGGGQLRDIISFCIRGDLGADVSNAVSHNENNMRPEEMGKLFNQIGVQNVLQRLGETRGLQEYFGEDNPGRVAEKIRTTMEDFFRRRNEIAHAIQIGASIGPTTLNDDVNFFGTISAGLVRVLKHECVGTPA